MNDDAVLLRRYAEEGSEAAFAELVHRHVNLVYGAALRRTNGDRQQAADVAQQVFTALARNAQRLSRHAVLAGWLHTATRNAALNLMISEQRRKARELEALALAPTSGGGEASPQWETLRLWLDSAIDELPETDRAAVVLRFLEHRAFAEIGAALRVSEDAARMRTDRALEKLRVALVRRGVTSSAAALGAVVLGQPLISAPSGLAAALISQSLVAAPAGLLATAFASFMFTKLITTAALGAMLAFGLGTYIGHSRAPAALPPRPTELPRPDPAVDSLRQENQRLQAHVSELAADLNRLTEVSAKLTASRAAPPPLGRAAKGPTLGMALGDLQGAVLNNLRQIDAARDQFALEFGRPPASVHELVGRYIKTVRTVGGEDYADLSMASGQPLTVMTPDGISVTYDPSGATTTKPEFSPEMLRVQELARRIEGMANKAVSAYRAAHEGKNPPDEQALLPYFSTPEEGADFVEFIQAQKAAGR